MKLLIDIPERAYTIRKENPIWYDSNMDKAIARGIPFEKELEKIKEELNTQGLGRCDGKIFDKEYNRILDKHIKENKE